MLGLDANGGQRAATGLLLGRINTRACQHVMSDEGDAAGGAPGCMPGAKSEVVKQPCPATLTVPPLFAISPCSWAIMSGPQILDHAI